MKVVYQHTQIGTVLLACLLGGVVLIIILATVLGWHPGALLVLVVLLAALLLFHSLTVEIKNAVLECRFGVGIIRKRFALKEVRAAVPVRNHWYYGLGIRYTPRGWLFCVSGLSAVEIILCSGKRYRIGTDQPAELAEAICKSAGLGTSKVKANFQGRIWPIADLG